LEHPRHHSHPKLLYKSLVHRLVGLLRTSNYSKTESATLATQKLPTQKLHSDKFNMTSATGNQVRNRVTLPSFYDYFFNISNPVKRFYVPSSASSNSTSFASITLSDGNNYLFYYDSGKNIACLHGKDAAVYSNTTVQPSAGVTIQAGTLSPLAATAWENDSGQLKEVSC
jgi:hypothetical protein